VKKEQLRRSRFGLEAIILAVTANFSQISGECAAFINHISAAAGSLCPDDDDEMKATNS
jgi:hypothetical protein